MSRRSSHVGVQEERHDEALGQVVRDPSLYAAVKTPGSLQPSYFFPPFSAELVLLTLPDVVNPLSLINSEVVVGGRKDSLLMIEGQKYKVATYPVDPDATSLPSLFLPDQDGQLSKVTSEIKACLVVKGEVEEKEDDGKVCVDIAALRSVHYKAPKDLPRRDFFSKRKIAAETTEPAKRRRKNAVDASSTDNARQASGALSPKKKKKKSLNSSSHTGGPSESPVHEEKHRVSLHSGEAGSHIKGKVKEERVEPVIGDAEPLPSKKKKKVKREEF